MPDAIGGQLRGSVLVALVPAAEGGAMVRVAVAVGEARLDPPPQATNITHASSAAVRFTRR